MIGFECRQDLSSVADFTRPVSACRTKFAFQLQFVTASIQRWRRVAAINEETIHAFAQNRDGRNCIRRSARSLIEVLFCKTSRLPVTWPRPRMFTRPYSIGARPDSILTRTRARVLHHWQAYIRRSRGGRGFCYPLLPPRRTLIRRFV